MDAKAKVVPYEVGGWYRQQDREWVQLVGIASPGSHYECMYSIDADGQHIHRYTNRPGDYGRVTGTAHDYSDPRNIPPTIPITDHESAMAEVEERRDHWHDYSVRRVEEIAKLTEQLSTLLTGLEALAGELSVKLSYAADPDATYSFSNDWVNGRNSANADAARRIRTLTNSAKGSGKISVTQCRCVEGSRDQELCMDKRTCSRITPHPANSENHEVLKS